MRPLFTVSLATGSSVLGEWVVSILGHAEDLAVGPSVVRLLSHAGGFKRLRSVEEIVLADD